MQEEIDFLVNERVTNEKNGKRLDTNQRKMKLFLDIITIAAIQSCTGEKVLEGDKKNFAKVLMKRIYGLSSSEQNIRGCKSIFRSRCGF